MVQDSLKAQGPRHNKQGPRNRKCQQIFVRIAHSAKISESLFMFQTPIDFVKQLDKQGCGCDYKVRNVVQFKDKAYKMMESKGRLLEHEVPISMYTKTLPIYMKLYNKEHLS